jgi:hypothetical protein
MNEYTLIRRENLKGLRLSAKALNYQVGNSVSYWFDLLRGDKDFGEKTARKIEAALGLPPRILDEPGACTPQSINRLESPTRVKSAPAAHGEQPALATDTLILAKWFEKLPEDSLARVKTYAIIMQSIISALGELEATAPVPDTSHLSDLPANRQPATKSPTQKLPS